MGFSTGSARVGLKASAALGGLYGYGFRDLEF